MASRFSIKSVFEDIFKSFKGIFKYLQISIEMRRSECDAFFDGQPVKLTKEVCGGAVWMAPEDNAGNSVGLAA
jgi:hypothetical protein